MFHLLEHLNKNHKTTENVVEDLMTNFGVNVKNENDLYLFKYGIISSDWTKEITRECRGTIMKHEGSSWKCMSRPWSKFFNQHEGHCPIFEEKAFNKFLPNSVLREKADGTCIQLWHDDEKWRISTLGTITTHNVGDTDMTFDELFLKTAFRIFFDELKKDLTYLFELCAEENRIVTKYLVDHVILLGARDRDSGEYISEYELDYEINYGAFREGNIRVTQSIHLFELNIKTLEDVKAFIESESNSDKYGKYPEGFVLYDKNNFHPIAKMKNARYMSLHHVGGGDIKHSMNQIIDAIFLGHIDDVYDVLSDRLKRFADDVKHKAALLENEAQHAISHLKKMQFDSRKTFALEVNKIVDKKIRGFFFQNANKFLNGEDIEGLETWFKSCYNKFDWKNDILESVDREDKNI